MSEEELGLAIYTQPFLPVRLHLSNGKSYDIRSPGTVAIGRVTSSIVVGGGIQVISNLHVTHVELLEPEAAVSGR